MRVNKNRFGMKNSNNNILGGFIRQYKAWRDRKLRKRIILGLLSHPKYYPDERGMIYVAENLIYYINNGVYESEQP